MDLPKTIQPNCNSHFSLNKNQIEIESNKKSIKHVSSGRPTLSIAIFHSLTVQMIVLYILSNIRGMMSGNKQTPYFIESIWLGRGRYENRISIHRVRPAPDT